MSDIFVLKDELIDRGIKKVSCYSCVWSIGSLVGLRCKKTGSAAFKVCNQYMRESGADEPEDMPDMS